MNGHHKKKNDFHELERRILSLEKSENINNQVGSVRNCFVYVIAPSLVGGAGKISLELISTTSLQTNNELKKEFNNYLPNCPFDFVLVYFFLNFILGIISGFIGTILTGEIPNNRSTNKWKIAGLSLVYALFFPLVINTISDNFLLLDENNKLRDKVVRVQNGRIEDSESLAINPDITEDTRIEVIKNIERAVSNADSTDDLRQKSIQLLAEFVNTQETTYKVQESAIKALTNIAINSEDKNQIKDNTILILDKIQTQHESLKEITQNQKERLKARSTPQKSSQGVTR